jgi:hypothetical protein
MKFLSCCFGLAPILTASLVFCKIITKYLSRRPSDCVAWYLANNEYLLNRPVDHGVDSAGHREEVAALREAAQSATEAAAAARAQSTRASAALSAAEAENSTLSGLLAEEQAMGRKLRNEVAALRAAAVDRHSTDDHFPRQRQVSVRVSIEYFSIFLNFFAECGVLDCGSVLLFSGNAICSLLCVAFCAYYWLRIIPEPTFR